MSRGDFKMERGTILTTANNRYEIAECLGRGTQGSVYKARRQDGFTVAIELVREYTADALRRLQTEGWTYQKFDSRFVKLLDWRLDCARPFLVMEFCKHGSARTQINYLSTWHSVTIPLLAQAAAALEELHKHGLLYRDFKPENLLLTQEGFGPWIARLGDAGLICASNRFSFPQMTQFARGTLEYMAPEALRPGASYTASAESFAFGVTAHELLNGTRPAAGSQVAVGPHEIHSLLTRLIAIDPNARPTLAEVRASLEVASGNLRQRNIGIAVGLVTLVVIAAIGFSGKK